MQDWLGYRPRLGIYGYMLGGVGYALLGCSRQLAVGPTCDPLMIAGSLAPWPVVTDTICPDRQPLGLCVAVLCFIAWLFRLSLLFVRSVSDSILVGFKAGAGLTIIMDQSPSLFGVARRAQLLRPDDPACRPIRRHQSARTDDWSLVAILFLLLGERFLPGKPVGLTVVALSILMASFFGLPARGIPNRKIPGRTADLRGAYVRDVGV